MTESLRIEFQRIIDGQLLTTHFQPIFDVREQAVLGYEALTRGPQGSPLYAPTELFDCAFALGRLSELERLCRKLAIAQFATRGLAGKLFLNVSPMTLLDPAHPKGETLLLAQQYGVASEQLVIEITERDPVEDPALLRSALQHYRDMGLSIAIDDLGTGYSGLKNWSELRPDIVKIDRYFVQDCHLDLVKREFLRTIFTLGKATQAAIIAEGIEKPEEFELLKRLGMRYAQGFYLAKPSLQPDFQYPLLDDTPRQDLRVHSPMSSATGTPQSMPVTELTHSDLAPLVTQRPAVSLALPCKKVWEIFEHDKQLFSLAVVDDAGLPVGLVYRDRLAELFSGEYGHALYQRKPVQRVMETSALIVDIDSALTDVSKRITDEQEFDVRRDIIVSQAGRYLGLVKVRTILKHITEQQLHFAIQANPLTSLPGNVVIQQQIQRRLDARQAFVVAYLDLNHFKSFNDVYGYACGDEVIKLLAEQCQTHCEDLLANQHFIGHIGGDDFVLVVDGDDINALEQRAQRMAAGFAGQVAGFFSDVDRQQGGYWAQDRSGQPAFYPLVSVAIGIVQPDLSYCHNNHQVAALAADAKKQAKKLAGNAVFVCQRHKPNAPMLSEPSNKVRRLVFPKLKRKVQANRMLA